MIVYTKYLCQVFVFQGFAALDPFIPIHVTNYSDKEATSMMEYYTDRRWIHKESGMLILMPRGCGGSIKFYPCPCPSVLPKTGFHSNLVFNNQMLETYT